MFVHSDTRLLQFSFNKSSSVERSERPLYARRKKSLKTWKSDRKYMRYKEKHAIKIGTLHV